MGKGLLTIAVSTSIGVLLGVLLQWNHIPGGILTNISRYFDNSIGPIAEAIKPSRDIILTTRVFKAAVAEDKYDTEEDSAYEYQSSRLDLNKAALILIDVWAYHPNDGWLERSHNNIQAKIAPLLELARGYNFTIIHAPHNQEIARGARPLPNELVVNTQSELVEYLDAYDIQTLLYAGYASNWCVLNRAVGIIDMNRLGYETILIRDCTIAFETPQTLDGEWANKVTINMVEFHWGATTTLEDVARGLKARQRGSLP